MCRRCSCWRRCRCCGSSGAPGLTRCRRNGSAYATGWHATAACAARRKGRWPTRSVPPPGFRRRPTHCGASPPAMSRCAMAVTTATRRRERSGWRNGARTSPPCACRDRAQGAPAWRAQAWTTGRVRRRAVAACIPMHRHRTVEADDPLIDTYREWGSPICCAMHCNSRSALQDLQHCHADVLSR
uniref:Uncharacterized protein n=1 Tax=Ralstonia solanacearum TaxID=305 RepID=A0A0S4WPZ0_RALSL|nr:protein of unknown function [Ralstonia solanacearum]